jgi:hypothetical protein
MRSVTSADRKSRSLDRCTRNNPCWRVAILGMPPQPTRPIRADRRTPVRADDVQVLLTPDTQNNGRETGSRGELATSSFACQRLHIRRTWSDPVQRIERCKDGDARWVKVTPGVLNALKGHLEAMGQGSGPQRRRSFQDRERRLLPKEAGLGLKRCPRADDAVLPPERGASEPRRGGELATVSGDPADRDTSDDAPALGLSRQPLRHVE